MDPVESWQTGIFEVGDYESEVRCSQFKIADPI